MRRKIFLTFSAIAFLFAAAVIPATANNNPTKNIVETAVEAGNFTILKKALKATGLDETLKSGSFTVFAPTDDAFNKLPAGTLDSLLKDKEALKKILLYHVVEGKMLAKDVVGKSEIKTVEGTTAKIKSKPEKVKINKSKIIKTDILATNGVIHAIDTVLMPGK
jgi:uncharacterized surface protein with fasciclin (FAS1) repeats